MLRFLPLIFKNTLRNRRRSVLTILSVAASLCLLGVLFAVYNTLFLADPTPQQALRLITRHKVSLTQELPASYGNKIRQVAGVRDATIWSWFGGTYKDARDPNNFFAQFAVEPDRFFGVRSEITLPEDQKQAFLKQRTAAMASDRLVAKHGWKLGDRIPIFSDIYNAKMEFQLVAIYEDKEKEETLYFNKEYLREAMGGDSNPRADSAGTFFILADSPDSVPRIAREIDAMFDNSPQPTKTESERQFALSFASFLGNLKLALMIVCGAVTFTILLVSGNTMAMSVRERIREVGILKTLGFSTSQVLSIVLGEALMISLLGGLVGVLLAAGLTYAVRQSPQLFLDLRTLAVTPPIAALCIGVALFIGFISSFIPAQNAARTPVLDALRNTG